MSKPTNQERHPDHIRVSELMDQEKTWKEIMSITGLDKNRTFYWIGKVRTIKKFGEPLRLKDQHLNRAQFYDFQKYWSKRPFHFQELFYKELNLENMKSAWEDCIRLLHQVRNSPMSLSSGYEDVADDTYSMGARHVPGNRPDSRG